MLSPCRSKLLPTLLSLASLCYAVQVVVAIEPNYLIDSDPQLQVPEPVRNVNPAMKGLWLSALDRPEIDMQRMAAETIARAHQLGIPDLADSIPLLEKILVATASHPASRFAAARALIVLDSRSSGDKLFEASQANGADLRQLIEPALAHWDFGPAKAMWIERLGASETRLRDLVLAMRGLGHVRERSALPRLMAIANDLTTHVPSLRLEAAIAAGQIAETGLEPDADRLAHVAGTRLLFANQLCAIRLLARHDTDAARQLLIGLADDAEPTIAAAALHRLNEIDAELVVPLAVVAMKSPDQRVRLEGANAFLKRPAAVRIAPLTELLADPHSGVRRRICDGLLQLSQNADLDDPVRDAATQVLGSDRWRGQEQAALLLGALQHKPAANRLVELLESPRTEVLVAAAWALRKIAVPETIPSLIDKAHRQTELRKAGDKPGMDDQVSHLFEALGELHATDAVPLLMQYVPKQNSKGSRSRGAAIWALGRINEGTRVPDLEDAFSDRIADFADKPPEIELVKMMSAIALARMKAVDQAPRMQGIVKGVALPIRLGVALRWAVKELTGEEIPPPDPALLSSGNWFLEPTP